MNYLCPDDSALTPIALSGSQKDALAAAVREAKKEGRRYRRNPENLTSSISAVNPVAESGLGSRAFLF